MNKPARPIAFPSAEPSRATGFARNALDRLAGRRGEPAAIAALAARPDARVLLFRDDRAVLAPGSDGTPRAGWTLAEAATLGARLDEAVLLGIDGDGPVFAALVPGTGQPDEPDPAGARTIDLRSLAQQGLVADDALGMIAQGRSLTGWHARHGYCANCGAPTRFAQGGYRRDCDACGANHFPRTDPVVIMLAVDGGRCLLGRQPRFQPGMYSCLAGFVEPGETLEDAVRREILEEAGLTVGRVVYHASQPWPFPSSLMIGCFAEALTTAIVREEEELEDVRWFDRDELLPMLERRHPDGVFTPPPMAIAHHLIRAFATGA